MEHVPHHDEVESHPEEDFSEEFQDLHDSSIMVLLSYLSQMPSYIRETVAGWVYGHPGKPIEPDAMPKELWAQVLAHMSQQDLSHLAQASSNWNGVVDDFRHGRLEFSGALPDNQVDNGVATVFTDLQFQAAMARDDVHRINIRTQHEDMIAISDHPARQAEIHAYGDAHLSVTGGEVHIHNSVLVSGLNGGKVIAHDQANVHKVAGGTVEAHDSAKVFGVYDGGTVEAHDKAEVTDVYGGNVTADGDSMVLNITGGLTDVQSANVIVEVPGADWTLTGPVYGTMTRDGQVVVTGVTTLQRLRVRSRK